MAHFVWPVMKLPGRMLIPWRIQTHPASRHRTPETFNAMRIGDEKMVVVRLPGARMQRRELGSIWRHRRAVAIVTTRDTNA